jgi:hypothetical protein
MYDICGARLKNSTTNTKHKNQNFTFHKFLFYNLEIQNQ